MLSEQSAILISGNVVYHGYIHSVGRLLSRRYRTHPNESRECKPNSATATLKIPATPNKIWSATLEGPSLAPDIVDGIEVWIN